MIRKVIVNLCLLLTILVLMGGSGWAQCTDENPCPEMARLMVVGGGVPTAATGNVFSGDSTCKGYFKFESGLLGRDEISNNDTFLTNTGVAEAAGLTTYDGGTGSADFEYWDNDSFTRTDANLPSGFPFKSGETNYSFSVAFWFKPEGSNWGTGASFFDKWGPYGVAGGAFVQYIGADRKLYLRIVDNAGVESAAFSTAFVAGTKYFCAVAYDNSDKSYRISVYDVDAAAPLGSDVTGTLTKTITANTQPFYVGKENAGDYMDGVVDSLVIFNRAITSAEITKIRTGTFP